MTKLPRTSRTRIGLFAAVVVGISSTACAQSVLPNTKASTNTAESAKVKDTVKRFEDLVYANAGETKLRLDLHLPGEPSVDAKTPVLVWIHGGGWRAGSRKKPPLRFLTGEGFAVASISYRFTEEAIFPAQIHDCKAALRWLVAHSDDYGLDTTRIAVAGSSAGGHLALLVGTSANQRSLDGTLGDHADTEVQIRAIVDFFGPSDFVLRDRTQSEIANSTKAGRFALLGGLRDGKVDMKLARVASPTTYVDKDSPPLLILHGTEDSRVLMDQSEAMVDAYQRVGGKAELIRVEGAGHGGMKFFGSQFRSKITRFLQETLAN